jgi:L-iditol 2-dehydrogenase
VADKARMNATMKAAVYKGAGAVAVESIPGARNFAGEILIRVEACGICHTDLKKIEYNLLPPPRIYGHETAGVVAAVGNVAPRFQPGDRVMVFHHIPCGKCFYCQKKLYAQCPRIRKSA